MRFDPTKRRSISKRSTSRRRAVFAFEKLDPRTLLSGDIQVSVYQDLNGNGRQDATDTPQSGYTIFLDNNSNGTLDAGELSQVTGTNGQTTFSGVPDQSYDVVEIQKPGFTTAKGFKLSTKASVSHNVRQVLFMNEALPTTTGTIQGTLWNDIDGDGVRGVGDPPQTGWTVYLDLNTNRVLDAGDVSTTTDATGFYSFPNLTPGRYRVREILQSNFSATTGFSTSAELSISAGSVVTQDFGNFNTAAVGAVSGVVWNDVNADGFRAAGDSALSGWTVFVDTNTNGVPDAGEPSTVTDAGGTYRFPSLLAGAYSIREVLQLTWVLSPSFHNPAVVTVIGGSEDDARADFANFTPVAGTAGGIVYNDVNGNGFKDSTDPGLAGWTVFVDANGNGVVDAGDTSTTTDSSGSYTLMGLPLGSSVVREIPAVGWLALTPGTGAQLLTLLNGATVNNVNFGNQQRTDGAISGVAFVDSNRNGVRDPGERGLAGITVFQDVNNNGVFDSGEPSTVTSADLFYTPAVDEAGAYAFTHLAAGPYTVREVVPDVLSGTPTAAAVRIVNLLAGEDRKAVDFADVFRANEIHGIKFNDLNGNHVRDAGEPVMPGVTIYLDLNRNDLLEAGEPTTVTDADGAYAFTGLTPGAYVVREILPSGHDHTYPTTTGGILWPAGVSNASIGNVSPGSITQSLAQGQTFTQTVSLTLPPAGNPITNKADVFLLFDDTGSFTGNSPIVRAAFPEIIASLTAALPGLDLGFGVGRFEEYANFAAELPTGRPFVLNQPIVSADTPSFAASIQAALNRTAPGYGGDQPETDIEALYQVVTGRGFDGNNNGTTADSGSAGLVGTQLTPGSSGDVPAFSSFTADPTGTVLPAQGTIGGAGFRDGALPIILQATDTGFAYQPKGETTVTGANGLTLPVSALTQLSRPSTPFNSGAGLQETVTGLNALGALVIGLGTNTETNLDPRQGLEALAKLTGAINRSTTPIPNGTIAPIAPGDPLYFQIASGFAASVASGVVSAIEGAATSVAVDLTLKASDPRVHITFTPGVVAGVGAGQTATFTVTFTGDGIPHRFDLQFVRAGTGVVLGSIPVVLGTPIQGDGYEYEDLGEGENHVHEDFGSRSSTASTTAAVFGRVFEDRNGNGVFDSTEPVVGGATVYVDLNGNTSFDSGEPTAVTSTTGQYVITNLTPGATTVRQVVTGGNVSTTPAAVLTTTAGTVTGIDFGVFPTRFVATASTSYLVGGGSGLSQIWVNTPATSSPTYSISTASLPSLTFTGGAGDDSLVVDFSQGNPTPAGGLSFDGGIGIDSLTVIGTAGNDVIVAAAASVTLNGSVTSVAGTESVLLDPGAGTHSLAVTGGLIRLAARSGTGVVSRLFSDVTISAGAALSVDTPPNHADRTVVVASTVSIAGTLDLGGNDLIVRGGNLSALTGLAGSGGNFAAGRWNGTGLASSAAATDGSSLTALGVVDQFTGLLDGQSPTAGDVVVKYTYFGDANLDGRVDGSDYTRIDNGAIAHLTGWANGDFNYDGAVDGSDYSLIDNAFNRQGAVIVTPSAAVAAAAPSVQPESEDERRRKRSHR